jgi:hypothetical protein
MFVDPDLHQQLRVLHYKSLINLSMKAYICGPAEPHHKGAPEKVEINTTNFCG